MLEIPIILDVHGLGTTRKTLCSIKIVNTGTGSKSIGNYKIYFKNARGDIVSTTSVKNFKRLEKNAFQLLRLALIKGIEE
jgi:hypothetical protein